MHQDPKFSFNYISKKPNARAWNCMLWRLTPKKYASLFRNIRLTEGNEIFSTSSLFQLHFGH
jgi:hypothetical protein